MPFDPDKYLASKEQTGFDPDKYLAQKESEPEQFGLLEGAYAKGEELVGKGLEAIQPILKPIAQVSEAVSRPAIEGFKSTPMGAVYNMGKEAISKALPKSLSDVAPSMYSDTGAGFKLQRGGIADPSYKGMQSTAESMAADPLNLVVPAAGKIASKGAELLGTGAKKVASGLSGLPKSVIDTYIKKAPVINEMIAGGAEGLPTKIHLDVKDTIQGAIKAKGGELAQSIKKNGGSVDIGEVAKPFDNALSEAEDMYYKNPTEINLDNYNTIKNIKDKYFAKGTTSIDPESAFRLQQDLKELTKFAPKERVTGNLQGLPTDTKTIAKAARDSYGKLNEQFETLTSGESKRLKDVYAKYMKLQDDVESLLGNPDKTFRTLKTANNPAKKMIKQKLKELDKEFGTDLQDKVDLMEAYTHLENPSIVPISSGGTTSTSRTLTGAGLGGAVGGSIGSAMGIPQLGAMAGTTMGTMATSPAAIKKYLDMISKYKDLTKNIKAPKVPAKYNLPAYRGAVEVGKDRGKK